MIAALVLMISEAQCDDDGASKRGDSPVQSASTLYTDSGFRCQSTGEIMKVKFLVRGRF